MAACAAGNAPGKTLIALHLSKIVLILAYPGACVNKILSTALDFTKLRPKTLLVYTFLTFLRGKMRL